MSLAADLGSLAGLATAIGLLDEHGAPRDAWLSAPGSYLSRMLSDDTQRQALVQFVDDILGGPSEHTDGTLTWLPLMSVPAPDLTVFLVLDARPDHVVIGVGAELSTSGPDSHTTAHVPVFRCARENGSVPDPIALGTAAGTISLTSEVTIDPDPPAPGQLGLGGVRLRLAVPTDGSAPDVGITLVGLQLPGASAPSDVILDVTALDQLEDTVRDLLLGVLAQQAAGAGGAVAALAGLLGLTGDEVPALPFAQLGESGPTALAQWFQSVVAVPAAHDAWLGHLAGLLGGAVSDGQASVTLGHATLRLGAGSAPGQDGHPMVTVTATLEVAADGIAARAQADLLEVPLAAAGLRALPRLEAGIIAGRRTDTDPVLVIPGAAGVGIDALRLGIGLDASRRPVLVLAADGVTIGGRPYGTLDLSSPQAIAEAGATVLATVVDQILAGLGPAGDVLRVVLGTAAPAAFPDAPTLDLAAFMSNPVGALAARWHTLVTGDPAVVRAILEPLRDAIADAAVSSAAVTGTGTQADPWRVPVVGPLTLLSWVADGRLVLALGAGYTVSDLGHGCLSIGSTLLVRVAELDLPARTASFLTSAGLSLTLTANPPGPVRLEVDGLALAADQVTVEAGWAAGHGVRVTLGAPGAALETATGSYPLPLPAVADDGTVTFTDWDALEAPIAALAAVAPVPWLSDLLGLMGWGPGQGAGPHLPLADLVADPAGALRGWLAQVALSGSPDVLQSAVSLVGRLLAAADGHGLGAVTGTGTPDDPYLVPLGPGTAVPALAVWWTPDGPAGRPVTEVSGPTRNWRPGDPGLPTVTLADALGREATLDEGLADLLAGRTVTAGLDAVLARWSGTDGLVAPPAAAPAGVSLVSLPDVGARGLTAALDLAGVLGAAPPATVVHVAVDAPGNPLPAGWPDVLPPGRVVDLRAASRTPESFAVPLPATGDWYALLGGRDACRLDTGDADGVLGQVARLRRVVDALAPAGPQALVGHGAAGHPAMRAAQTQAAVTALVTTGTPVTPVTFSVIDADPAGDTLRLLQRLLPAPSAETPDDGDLAAGRALLAGLADLTVLGDPAGEIGLPATTDAATGGLPANFPRAGLQAVAVYGVMSDAALSRAVTATVLAGLADRAQNRAGRPAADPVTLRAGLRLPLASAGTGSQLVTDGYLRLNLLAVTSAQAGHAHAAADPRLAVHLGIGRATGWLVGGPDPGRAAGTMRETELRRVSLHADVPLAGQAGDSAAVVLHEVRAFGVVRERWTLAPAGTADPLADAVTVLLPEASIVLSRLAERLGDSTAGPAGPLVTALLRAAGLMDASGGFLGDALDDLLHDPTGHLRAAAGPPAAREAAVTALRGLISGASGAAADPLTLGPVTLTPDLAAGRLHATITSPAGFGAVSWTATADVGTDGAQVQARLGMAEGAASSAAGGLRLEVSGTPLAAAIVWDRPGTSDRLNLVHPDPGTLVTALLRAVPAEALRLAMGALRDLDATARPVVDALLDALGMLGPEAAGTRPVVLPAALLTDPGAWLTHQTVLGGGAYGLRADRVINLLDAIKPLLGVPGDPGQWRLAAGVTVIAAARANRVSLSVTLDPSALTAPGGGSGRLSFGGTAALLIAGSAPPGVSLQASAGVAGASAGRQAVYLTLSTGAPASLLIRPAAGADIVLLPGGPGLGALAAGAAQALPLVLNAVAAEDGADLAGDVGRFVAGLGSALGLLSQPVPPTFDGQKLLAWGDPAAALAAAWPTLAEAALTQLAAALQPLLIRVPGSAAAAVSAGTLQVTISAATLSLRPSPFSVGLAVAADTVPALGQVQAGLVLDSGGLHALDVVVGPVPLDLGGVVVHPVLGVHAGTAPDGGRRVETGLDLGGGRRVLARWLLGGSFTTVVVGATSEDSTPAAVAAAMVEAVADVVGGVVLSSSGFGELLAKPVGTHDVGFVLRGALLADGVTTATLDAGLADFSTLLGRLQRLAHNLAACEPHVAVDGLTIGLSAPDNIVSVTVAVTGRFDVVPSGSVIVSLENDATWINPAVPAGLTLKLLDVSGSEPSFAPGILVGGLGIRFAGGAGPLLDTVISIDSIALHAYAEVAADGVAGGAQLVLDGLGVAVGGASGGNPVAQGLVAETGAGGGSGGQHLAPKFSPALAMQKHPGSAIHVTLSAGPSSGPWWVTIQKGFGPVYIEQVGLAVTVTQDQLQRIGVLLDGRVSIFGLTAAVDDLQISCLITAPGAPWTAAAWSVDLAGLAVDADMAGLVLQGGLRKYGDDQNIEYVGMLLARFAAFGLSIYGGYARVTDGQGPYTSFFAFGALVGPIGGPPAFFVTGIGGGFGINRQLIVPADLSQFGQYPLVKALDPGATPSGDPMAELDGLRAYFPSQRGTFWFAGGISFTSFALVDGVAVVAIQIGDGFELTILGLARMALPRPQLALVSIELALVARFSTRDGVLWIQGQLTDNSWLLYPDVRLTGGFAFVLWFAGPYDGEFVLTLGGYHPDFHRAGYPQVPRLGLSWQFGPVAVKGESYFALTSEAVMAGVRVQASADFGAAWAHVEFGADGIVYFDPFHFRVTAYASISAGVTVDLFFGSLSISVSISATVMVEGPDFHAIATFDVGPVSLSVEIGDSDQGAPAYLSWADFVAKYLEAAAEGVARAITSVPGLGAAPPSTPQGASTPKGTADGSSGKPFEVLCEFQLTLTTTIPLTRTDVGTSHHADHPYAGLIGVAPMGKGSVTSALTVVLNDARGNAAVQPRLGTRVDDGFIVEHRADGTFPRGVWGKPKPLDSPSIPAADVLPGVQGVVLTTSATHPAPIGPYQYNKVETGRRQPLPLLSESAARAELLAEAADVADVIGALGDATDPAQLLETAVTWLRRAGASRTVRASYIGERAAPPRLGTLTDRLAPAGLPTDPLQFPPDPVPPLIDGRVLAPVAVAVLGSSVALPDLPPSQTSLARPPQGVPTTAPPSLALVSARVDPAIAARLVLVSPQSTTTASTLVATGAVPATGLARSGSEAAFVPGAASDGLARLADLTVALGASPRTDRSPAPGPAAADNPAVTARVGVGELAVLRLPNADADLDPVSRPALTVSGAAARIVMLGHGGAVLSDEPPPPDGSPVTVPQGTERIAIAAVGSAAGGAAPGLPGWHSGQSLAYVGWSTALAAGAIVRAEGRVSARGPRTLPTGWVQVAELVSGAGLVETRFAVPVDVVAVIIDDPAQVVGADERLLGLGLSGATRRAGANGSPVPATLIVTGGRTFRLFEVIADPADRVPGVTVTIASGPGWRLAGVVGATGPVADVAGLARQGLDAAVAPLIAGVSGSITLGWTGQPAPPEPRLAPNPPQHAGRH